MLSAVYLSILVLSSSANFTKESNHHNASVYTATQHDTGTISLTDTSPVPGNNVKEYPYSLHMLCEQFSIPISNCSCPTTALVCEAILLEDVRQNCSSVYNRAIGFTISYSTIALMSSVFGLAGNAAVILMAYRHRSNISPCKLHIAELAFVNLVFSAVQVASVVPLYWSTIWIYGTAMCKITKGLLEMSSLLSSGFFQLIAVERYLLVVRTFNMPYLQQYLRHRLVIFNLIIVSMTIVPFVQGVEIEVETGRCVNFIGANKWIASFYAWFTFIIYSVLPICITSVLAVSLFRYFGEEKKSLLMVRREHLNKRIMMNMLIILSLFIFCTVPSRLVTITMDTVDYQSHNAILAFQFISYTLYSLQGTLNPILYSMLAKQWRKNFSEVVLSTFHRSVHGTVRTLVTVTNHEDTPI